MSAFDTAFAATARPALLDQFGQAVTYTPAGGAGTGITAIFHEHGRDANPAEGGMQSRFAQLSASAQDVTDPHPDDRFTVGTEVWDVRDDTAASIKKDGGMVTLELVKHTAMRAETDRYRGR